MTGRTQIVPVRTPAELDRFVRLPARLYAGDKHFVPPLLLERKEALSPKKNPLFEHAEVQLFLGVRDGRDVGRISAQVDRLVQDPAIGHFGMIAAEDDAEIFAALFAAAEGWLRERGRTRVLGPFSLSINEETGLLIQGFDTPPMMFMPHDPPYAAVRVEEQGYAKAKDVLAYLYDMSREFSPTTTRMIEKRKPSSLIVRNLDMKRYDEEFDTITAIFNDAWKDNWSFIPFTEAEIRHMARSLKPLINPDLVAIVEYNGQPVAFGITLPNLNEAIADFGGRLLPFNWIKLLLRLKRGTRTGRVPLMGVKRTFSAGILGAMAPFLVIHSMHKGAAKTPMQKVEMSWILEDNLPMRHVIEKLGAVAYKTYRVYEKSIAT
ncbi:MAG: hypothetical protein K0Q76_3637 [Panacagrimonas sp.]|nr:dATP pyrophosphohydrolase [Panacagrimonas sp.]MCC2658529.1 hypothetical protein [Panacagrimonas sp.]